MNAIEKSALSRLDEFVTSRDKFQFVEWNKTNAGRFSVGVNYSFVGALDLREALIQCPRATNGRPTG